MKSQDKTTCSLSAFGAEETTGIQQLWRLLFNRFYKIRLCLVQKQIPHLFLERKHLRPVTDWIRQAHVMERQKVNKP